MKRYLAVLLAVALLVAVFPVISMAQQTATVVGGWLRLRAQGNFSSQVLNSYYTGTVVTILDGPVNGWYHVRTPDNATGYMYGNYLKIGGSTPSSETNAYVTSTNGLSVNMRSGPATTYSVVRSYPVGTPVTVLTRGSVWSYISIYGQSGYMMTKFLTNSSPEPSPYSVICRATVWSSNGYGVRLRTGAGTGYSVIGTYSVGTRVEVLQKGAYWDYIRVGSRTGWMMNQFLIYDSANAVTGVSLNNMNPSVNDVMSILSLQPAGASVTYQWKVGGVVKGTSAKYTVTSADAGQSIQLVVYGTGAYTGSASSALTNPVKGATELNSVTLNNYIPTVGCVLSANLSPAGANVSYSWYVGGVYVSSAATYTVQEADVGKEIYLIVSGISPYTGTLTSGKTDPVTGSQAISSLTVANVTSSSRGVSAPQSGDVLRALYVPTAATVTYAWYRGGTLVSGETGNNYTLTDADVGYKMTVEVTGYGSYTGTKSVSTGTVKPGVVLDIPVITTAALPNGVVNSSYTATLSATGSNVTWALASGYVLPAGLTMDASGVISGTPAEVGNTTIRLIASNSDGSDTEDFVIEILANDPPAEAVLTVQDVDFGTVTEGDVISSKNITISNSGDAAATGITLSVDQAAFVLGSVSVSDIQPAGDAQVSLEAVVTAPGTYSATVTVSYNGGKTATGHVSLTINAKPAKAVLTGYQPLSAVTDVPNGTGLYDIELPTTVTLNTDSGVKTGTVNYQRSGVSYDPAVTTEQTFTVPGTIVLPEDVDNPSSLSLSVSVSVTVLAQ